VEIPIDQVSMGEISLRDPGFVQSNRTASQSEGAITRQLASAS
jgi:hypothetical protein